jgi:uncharacterized protein (DUF305 family)
MKFAIGTLALVSALSLSPALAEGPAKKAGAAAFEKRFLDMMTHHHQDGIEMAQVCQQKASMPELKDLCGKMASSQGTERQQMVDWRKAWYQDQGGAPALQMSKMAARHKQHMAKLNTLANNEFDRAFVQVMTEHHRQGAAESKACVAQAEHAELKQL